VISEYFENNFETVLSLEEFFLLWRERIQILKDIISAFLLLEKYSIGLKYVIFLVFSAYSSHFYSREFSNQNLFITNNLKCKMKCDYRINVYQNNDDASISSSPLSSPDLIASFGKIIFQIITGIQFQKYFSSSNPNLRNHSLDGIKLLDGCPESLKTLMTRCLDHSAHQNYDNNNNNNDGEKCLTLSVSTFNSSGLPEIHTIDEIWKELDEIWNMTFPESPSNNILRRSSLSRSVSSHNNNNNSNNNMTKLNPFEDDAQDMYYQDPNYQQRPSMRR
jgi:hypothetical protein